VSALGNFRSAAVFFNLTICLIDRAALAGEVAKAALFL